MAVSDGSTALFRQHLEELQKRLLTVVIIFLVFSIVGYLIHNQLLQILIKPLNQKLFYSSPTGGLEFVMNISFWFGLALTFPFLIYNLLQFIRPAISDKIIVKTGQIIVWSYLLLIAGVSFAYNYSLPFALKFLKEFSGGEIESLITTNAYLSFTTIYLLGFGIIFLLPLVLLSINSFARLNTKKLGSYRGRVIVASFILAAIITPTPDPVNQAIMAAPIIILYEVSIMLIWLQNRNRLSSEAQGEMEAKADQLYQTGKYPEAKRLYQRLCRDKSASSRSLTRLVAIYIKEERYIDAEVILAEAIRRDATVASYYSNLGIARFSRKKYRLAAEAFQGALRLQPDNVKYQQLYQLAKKNSGS